MENLIPAIKVNNLSLYYGISKVIEGMSLDIYQNQVTAIIGPSGCGKSSFIKTLNRVNELEGDIKVKGRVEFIGQNIYDRCVNVNLLRRQIGMVFQTPNPFPISIYDNVAYGLRTESKCKKIELDDIVESALRSASLWHEVKDKLNKSALGISGGQQQRLCIARALAVKPKVLLMDEPCSSLDPLATMRIEELIKSLRSTLTIVVVTHNMQQASRISDFTAFMNSDESRVGQLIEYGSTIEMFCSPLDTRTHEYISGCFG